MSKTPTNHEPSPDERARGADDKGFHHPGDITGEAHGIGDHGEDHGHDDHAHDAEALGPIDVQAWGAMAIGVAAGLLIVLCLVLTTTILP